jgi:serine/threonine protein kinase
MAPESFDTYIYSKRTDIWNMGILLYYLVHKQYPFTEDECIIRNTICNRNKKYTSLFDNKRKCVYNNTIMSMLEHNERDRSSINKIIRNIKKLKKNNK